MQPAPSVRVAIYSPLPRLLIVVLFPPGSTKPTGPAQVKIPGNGIASIETEINNQIGAQVAPPPFPHVPTPKEINISATLNINQ